MTTRSSGTTTRSRSSAGGGEHDGGALISIPSNASTSTTTTRGGGGGGGGGGERVLFPTMLYDMLEDVEKQGWDHIVSWSTAGPMIAPHNKNRHFLWDHSHDGLRQQDKEGVLLTTPRGARECCSFRVHNIEQYENLVLPRYFKTNRYKSFQRNLNIHRFKHVRAREYTHPFLVKGKRALCAHIKRHSSTTMMKFSSVEATRRQTTLQELMFAIGPAATSKERVLLEHQRCLQEQEQHEEEDEKQQHCCSMTEAWMEMHSAYLLDFAEGIVKAWR